MATILFAPVPQRGHINPCMRIARALQSRGHRVVFCGVRDMEDVLLPEGFEFEPLFEAAYPRGTLSSFTSGISRLRGLKLLRHLRHHIRLGNRIFQAMLEGETDPLFERLKPDLLVCDEHLRHPAIVAYGHGVPTLFLNTTLPPMTDGTQAAAPTLGRTVKNWLLAQVRDGLIGAAGLLGLQTRFHRYLHLLARKHRYQVEMKDFSIQLHGPRTPELILCPRELIELGGLRPMGQYHYVEPCIDLDRKEADFPWERLAGDKPLILFSLGTQAFMSKHDTRLLHVALEAAALKPGWQFVIAVGVNQELAAYDQATPNVVAVRQVPQLQLLKKATAMVTHGGFNSVKECIYFGVPMVAIPLTYDQPRNADFVELHGLGVRASAATVTGAQLAGLLEQVATPAFRRGLGRASTRFRDAEAHPASVEVIERLLKGGDEPGNLLRGHP